MSKTLRVLMLADITGEGPDYHVGDEAMAQVAIERITSITPPQNVIMACASPEGVPGTYGIRAIPFYSTTRTNRRRMLFRRPHSFAKSFLSMLYNLARCDVVFVCGGGNLTSVWPGVLESRLNLFKWALRMKKRLILASQTLGPFTPSHKTECETVLSGAEWIGVRDKDFSEQQVSSKVHFAVDDAVFLRPAHSQETSEIIRHHPSLIALSLRRFGGIDTDELNTICATVARIAQEQGARTVFIPHHAPNKEGDIKIARQAQHIWPESAPLIVLDPIPMATALKALTSECDWVLTMRYHQLIFALSSGIPAIGLYVDEYTHAKLNGAFEQFGLEPRLLPARSAASELAPLVEKVRSERNLFREAAGRVAHEALEANLRPYRLLQGSL